ncbi:AcrR family transcriptional regulator [Cerasibacillus quisquiliarum]|uniref:TetR family transcriptional regulator n=1 Tax=Cerasibacillus quisquiliarum TaxID=227865 RepID=A0A511UVB0_9BACI|nr:TetR/AcrR family transcriptional regulator [Cerasibacillus quisquiliarum]MBB5145969.1 AcrR family transcriptional regulator [Cerasibacillus quisquiliarum]GEN30539.1 TetR family transcriptional regulator [Cerasibacillus quisquiliarum]
MKGGYKISELKNEIIQTSLTLFDKYGFHGVSVNKIVSEVGTSKGGFYHYFSSKDEVLYLIHDEFISYALKKAYESFHKHKSPTNKLRDIINNFVKVFDLYHAHITVFYQEQIYLPNPYEMMIKKKRDQFRDIIIKTIQLGVESDEFRKELHPVITAMAILGMVNWIYRWYRKDGKKSIEEIAQYYEDMIIHAVIK